MPLRAPVAVVTAETAVTASVRVVNDEPLVIDDHIWLKALSSHKYRHNAIHLSAN